MLDIQFIRDNPKLVSEKSKQKNVSVEIDKLLELDVKRRELINKVDTLKAEQRELNPKTKSKPDHATIEKATELKTEISKVESDLIPVEKSYLKLLRQVPNMPTEDVPIGADESANVVQKTVGEAPGFDFKPKAHWEIGESRDLIDRERAVKISGSRFVYLKGDLVRLQFALNQLAIDQLTDEKVIENLITKHKLNLVAKPYVPVLPPIMIKTDAYEATGRLKAEETTYKIDGDDLWLIASAEHSLCSMYINEIIDESKLPIRYLGYSTSFRREAGTYGKDTNGLIRLHHFDKMEMEVFSTPETGLDEHLLQIAIQEHLMGLLNLPYHVLLKSTGDIGDPNARGVDIEAWFPSQKTYRETHTADFMGDYQARSLKTRLKRANGEIIFPHTNDATAFAAGRTMAAIIENYQTADDHIVIPEVLRPYMGGQEEI
ncbi:MAG TPA: serine--tRNA ligase [Candidatus Saccharimonadales bacterium]|nr:serine--tRNA ligase [Candidatus Saccharimonadales bacterium]